MLSIKIKINLCDKVRMNLLWKYKLTYIYYVNNINIYTDSRHNVCNMLIHGDSDIYLLCKNMCLWSKFGMYLLC